MQTVRWCGGAALMVASMGLSACGSGGSERDAPTGDTGGNGSTAGGADTGGAEASGGAQPSSGGAPAVGGATGGAEPATGGDIATAGSAGGPDTPITAGQAGSGATAGTGGIPEDGGAPASGATTSGGEGGSGAAATEGGAGGNTPLGGTVGKGGSDVAAGAGGDEPLGGNAGGGVGGEFDESSFGLPETIETGPCGECPIGLWCGGGGDDDACGTVQALPNGKVCSVDGFCFKYPLPQNNTLRDATASGGVVWAVGDRGTVLRYDGESWSGVTNLIYTPNTSLNFWSVWVGPEEDVWIGGADALLLRGVGDSWNRIAIPTEVIPADDDITAVGGSSATSVWIGTAEGRLVHFDGVDFTLEATYDDGLSDLEVVAADDIYLSGAHGVDHYDGQDWTPEEASFSTIHAVAARTPTDVWAVGSNSNIYRKLAGTWQTHDRSGYQNYRGVVPLGANDVWVVGGEFVHFDGLGWTAEPAPDVFLAASGSAAGPAVAVGQNGATVHFTEESPVVVNDGQKQYWDTARAMHGYSNTDFWIAGRDRSADLYDDYSLLLHYDGASFTRVSATVTSWGALWVEAGGGVRLAPSAGSSARYYLPAGASSVQSESAGSSERRRAYFGTADDDLWVGGTGLMEYYDGDSWSPVAHPFAGSTTTYTAMWGSASDDIWAVTDTATAAHYDGESWEPVALPGAASGISGRSGGEIYAADIDCAYEYDGTSWSELHCFERTGFDTATVATCNDSDLWVGHNNGDLIHYRGTYGWRDVRTGTDSITDLFCVTPDKVWASGSGQSVLLLER